MERVRRVDGKTSTERGYYISSLDGSDAQAMLRYIRGYREIENRLHWSLDVSFREDTLRNRVGYSAENFSRMRRLEHCQVSCSGATLKRPLFSTAATGGGRYTKTETAQPSTCSVRTKAAKSASRANAFKPA